LQQICPAPQQESPQQNCDVVQVGGGCVFVPPQGAATQPPFWQTSSAGQTLPQLPQFSVSFCSSTQ
jgi:hypothetical protein